MIIGDSVKTIHGSGIICNIEYYSRVEGGINRYGVKLEESPFFYPIAYFWPKELSKKS